MIIDALASIGAVVICRSAVAIIRWQFFVNRDGNSGRHGHYSSNPRIIQ